MCYSLADGGQRCASHTRNAYERAQRMVDDLYTATPRDDEYVWDARFQALDDAAVAYASTEEGRAKFTQDILDATTDQEFARLNSILRRGQTIREVNADIRERIRYHKRTVADRLARRPARLRTDDELTATHAQVVADTERSAASAEAAAQRRVDDAIARRLAR